MDERHEMKPAALPKLMYDDFLSFPDDGQRHELILTEKHVRGAPAVVVEILSPGTRRRDQTLKRVLYERAGVREYWMIEPDEKAWTSCSRNSGASAFIRR